MQTSTYFKLVTSPNGDVKTLENLGENPTEILESWDEYFGILLNKNNSLPSGEVPNEVVEGTMDTSIFPPESYNIGEDERWIIVCHTNTTSEELLGRLDLEMEEEEEESDEQE